MFIYMALRNVKFSGVINHIIYENMEWLSNVEEKFVRILCSLTSVLSGKFCFYLILEEFPFLKRRRNIFSIFTFFLPLVCLFLYTLVLGFHR